jgi:hypothetical protein
MWDGAVKSQIFVVFLHGPPLRTGSPAAHRSAPSCKRRSISAVLVKPIQRGQKNDLRLSMTGAEFLAEATELAG